MLDKDAKERIAQGLHTAVQNEHNGYHFYLMAARSTEDRQGREVFEQLAQEELDHWRFLKHQYEHLLDHGVPDAGTTLGSPLDLSGESPIFSAELKARVQEAHFEMSALSIAVTLELGAMNFYQAEADAAQDEFVKRFFGELAVWEQGHYKALLAQQEHLRGDYWSSGGFSPF